MIDPQPLVSVFVPVYNTARFVTEAIDSVLRQSHRNLEVLVSDDASLDGTSEVLRGLAKRDGRIKLFLQPKNLGPTGNCNFLLQRCTGKYVLFFAGDDVLRPECIARAVAVAESSDDLAIVFHTPGRIDDDSRRLASDWKAARSHFGTIEDFLKRGVYPSVNGMLVRRSFVERHRYPESLPLASDFSLIWHALGRSGTRFAFLAEELSDWRKHGASITMARAAECTRDAMRENYEMAARFPEYARFALQRTRRQALTLPRARKEPALRLALNVAFSTVVHWLDLFLSRVLGVRAVDAWRKSLLSRL